MVPGQVELTGWCNGAWAKLNNIVGWCNGAWTRYEVAGWCNGAWTRLN